MFSDHTSRTLTNANYIQTVGSVTGPPHLSSDLSSRDTPNTAIFPMYWVGGQWMVPSGVPDQSQTMGTSRSTQISLLPHDPQYTPGLETTTTRIRTHQHPGPPPLSASSNPSPGPQYLLPHSSEPTRSTTGGNGDYFSKDQSSLQAVRLAGKTTRSSSTAAIHYHHAYRPTPPTMDPPWMRPPIQRPQPTQTRTDTRIAAPNYGERRHKAHLDSEKRRRE
jgi:hypothetical protein